MKCIVGDLCVTILIVTGDVEIGGLYWDRDVGNLLVVLGNATIGLTNFYGGARVRGNLTVTRVLFGIDHSDSIYIGKRLRTPLAILADKSLYTNIANIKLLVGAVDRVHGNAKIENAVLDPAKLRELIVPELVNDDEEKREVTEVPVDVSEILKRASLGQPVTRRRARRK